MGCIHFIKGPPYSHIYVHTIHTYRLANRHTHAVSVTHALHYQHTHDKRSLSPTWTEITAGNLQAQFTRGVVKAQLYRHVIWGNREPTSCTGRAKTPLSLDIKSSPQNQPHLTIEALGFWCSKRANSMYINKCK